MKPSKRQTKSPTRPGPGRPDIGIRSGYARVEVYLPPDVQVAVAEGQAMTLEQAVEYALQNDAEA